MKTNPLKPALLVVALSTVLPVYGGSYNAFDCVRELMPITDRAAVQSKRGDVEEPFSVNEKFIVFPEISNDMVTGFYFYGHQGAAYYDAVELKNSTKHLGDLQFHKDEGIYELVAQPTGLETATIHYLPGFKTSASGNKGPVVLGVSVLPIIGAFMSRPTMGKVAYLNPKTVNDIVVKKWMAERLDARSPASVDNIKVNVTMLRLKTIRAKSEGDLWKPLKQELKLRKNWIQTHNLDEKAFKQLSLIMEGSCKE